MTINNKDELYHHGVKGMKWGVRKAVVRSSKSSTRRKPHKSATSPSRTKRILNKGKSTVSKYMNRKTLSVASSATTIAAGALTVSAILVPEVAGIAGVATAVNVANSAVSTAKAIDTLSNEENKK